MQFNYTQKTPTTLCLIAILAITIKVEKCLTQGTNLSTLTVAGCFLVSNYWKGYAKI